MEPEPHSDMCRVAVHTGSQVVDLTLPTEVPLAVMLPRVCDIVDRVTGGPPAQRPRQLWAPGGELLDTSHTLSDNGIRNGDTLILTASDPPAPPRITVDHTHALATAVAVNASGWDHARARATALIVATVLAGVAGITALPGAPGAPHLLLAASAAGGTAAVASRLSGQHRILFAGIAIGAGLTGGAALSGTFLADGAHRTGTLLTLGALAVLAGATRTALMLCGASGAANPGGGGASAPICLSAMVCGAAGSAVVGVVLTVASGSRADHLVGAVVSAALLLRARAHCDPVQRCALLLGGTCCAAATLVDISRAGTAWGPWLCMMALAGAVAAAVLGHRRGGPPTGDRAFGEAIAEAVDVAANAAIAAAIPLGCWALGVLDAVHVGPAR